MQPVALTIAGSDPSGGAGLQADLKTFHRHGVYGASVVTLLTAQNTRGVAGLEFVAPAFVLAQLDAVVGDIAPHVVKTGALGRADIVEAVGARLARIEAPVVVDPVLVSKHGHALVAEDAVEALVRHVLPHAAVVTPNLDEAARLAGMDVAAVASRAGMERAARAIAAMGARRTPMGVLVKGGHRVETACDLLLHDGRCEVLPVTRLETKATHGTGCTLAAAIAARLARGETLGAAVEGARRFVHEAMRTAPGLGGGLGPVNHFAAIGAWNAS